MISSECRTLRDATSKISIREDLYAAGTTIYTVGNHAQGINTGRYAERKVAPNTSTSEENYGQLSSL